MHAIGAAADGVMAGRVVKQDAAELIADSLGAGDVGADDVALDYVFGAASISHVNAIRRFQR